MALLARSLLLKGASAAALRTATPTLLSPLSLFSSAKSFSSSAVCLPKEEVTDRVIRVVKNFGKVEPSKITAKAHIINDLGLDSLDSVELVMALEDEFCIEIPDAEMDKIASLQDAIEFVSATPNAK
eukprot:gnl/Hemi2/19266_TR6398_c0_g1_i1.p1 gnl/Hemi2/19266_TR6398_c0_g1~~gnl/Hemi2/19266_TR6398_c0_g1_i1.p1  ORF type:complete len:143 (+),score=72.29 gnl/Hemi2/19266_TR6398_c0_g1_i1:49-429(+)